MRTLVVLIGITLITIKTFGQVNIEKTFDAKGQKIEATAYSADGKYIAIATTDKKIIILSSNNLQPIATLKGLKQPTNCIAFSDNSRYLAAADDKKISLWNLVSMQLVTSFKGHDESITAIKFSSNENLFASASNDQTIKIWNINTQKILKTLTGHSGSITTINYSKDGNTIISGSTDKTIKIWDTQSATIKKSIPVNGILRDLVFNEKTNIIIGCGENKHINIWDEISGSLINTFFTHKENISTIDLSSDGNYILSGGDDKLIIITDIRSGLMVFKSPEQKLSIKKVLFNPKGNSFIALTENSSQAHIWNTQSLNIKAVDNKLIPSSNKTVLPSIKIISPKNNEELYETSVNIHAEINSESSLRKIELLVNGSLFISKDRSELMLATSETNIYTINELIVLKEGENTVQIKVKNMAGDAESEMRKMFYLNLPSKPLSWISPAQPKFETYSQYFELKALISPSVSKQNVGIFINNEKYATQLMPANGGILTQKIALNSGENKIKVVLTSSKFEKEAEERILTYKMAEKPQIEWLDPTIDTLSFVSSARVRVNVNSKTNLKKIEILVNGSPVYSKINLQTSWLKIDDRIKLIPGHNTVTIVAQNSAGEVISPLRLISYEKPEKTIVSWIYPGADSLVLDPVVSIKACIQSKTPVSKIEVFNNDKLIVSETTILEDNSRECLVNFTKRIKLNAGKNKIKIISQNAGGITESDVRVMDFAEATVAKIIWENPINVNTSVSEAAFTIKACIKSNSQLKAYSILLNRKIYLNISNPQPSDNECNYFVNQTLALEMGNNQIILRALNASGDAMSTPINIEYKTENPYRFALIFGNEDYSSYQSGLESESDVDFAKNDANAFKETCIKFLNIKEENILYFENARFVEMKRGVARMASILKATAGKAELIVYYAGHGFPHEQTKEPYLIPVDASGTDLEFGGIKLTEFYTTLTEYPSERVTIFIDACFSGGARNQGLMAARGVRINPKENKESIKKNLIVFTASSGSQTSLPYAEKEHGLFTYYLVKKIEEKNGNISYSELSDYLKSEIAIRSIIINGKEQEPQTNISPDIAEEWKTWNLKE